MKALNAAFPGTHRYLAGLLALVLAAGTAAVWWTARCEDGALRQVLITQTRMVANAVDFRYIRELSGSDADVGTPAYQRLKEQLTLARLTEPKCRSLYLFGQRRDGTIFFLIDSEPPDSRDSSPPGKVYSNATDALRNVFAAGSDLVEGPTGDQRGTWASGLVPQREATTGKVIAVFGADFDARDWNGQIIKSCTGPASVTLLAAVLLALTGMRITQRLAEAQRQIVARGETLGRQERVSRLQQDLLGCGGLAQKVTIITQGVVDIFSADFCRIWISCPGDLCLHGCVHAAATEDRYACTRNDLCLHLVASSGRYTHTDGAAHRRVPFGCYKIGRIASGQEHRFLTNDVTHDPKVHDHDWARELGLVSFAGYQLRVPGNGKIGVMALFSKQPLTPEEDGQLDALSITAAQAIASAQADESLRNSEERHRILFESSRDAIMTLAPPSWQFTACNPASVKAFGFQSADELLTKGPGDISPEYQPNGLPSSQLAAEAVEKAMREGSNFFEWTHKRQNGETFPATILLARFELKGQSYLQGTIRDITRQKEAERNLQKSHDETKQLLESLSSVLIGVDKDGHVTAWNKVASQFFGIARADALQRVFDELEIAWNKAAVSTAVAQCRSRNRPVHVADVQYKRSDGTDGFLSVTVGPVEPADSMDGAFLLVAQDVTNQKYLQTQLAQAQRIESVGRLAAGIAHEINTPTQFIGDNTRFLGTSFPALKYVITQYERLMEAARIGSVTPELVNEVEAAAKTAKVDYLLEQIPEAISDSLEGIDRVAKIVGAMKDFSHPGEQQMLSADINKAIESTVIVTQNEWKYVADMVLNLDPSLPPVPCFVADFNQVILNIVVNGAHAIADAVKVRHEVKGTITITTSKQDGWAEIRIADTGTGVPEEHRNKIFDPFFTTKEIGKGTGQGLAIARSVIVDKHHGTLTFETETGKGTTFIIRLPLNTEPEAREAGAA